ncbi:hypothetical protein GPUN_1826 [Glaciecola punicea ACAM 611]|jgi:hypothetical protein|uniref:Uncharacterized protein n=1 Tax=Glaciecola punicea ACAM 611 TaxID=1121923 RepID=H5TCB5_9ALTE|nr:hypothetical protein GPUN_1826 [Glaciecola punicea ACAM 611]
MQITVKYVRKKRPIINGILRLYYSNALLKTLSQGLGTTSIN